MKIAFIGQKGIPAIWGGVEQHVDHLSRRIAKKGHEVLVYARPYYTSPDVASRFNNDSANKNIRIVLLWVFRSKHFEAIFHTLRSIFHAMKENVDIYHFQSVGPSLLSWIPRVFRPRAQVITTFHSPDRLHQKWGFVASSILTIAEWSAVTFAHRTIVVSKDLKSYADGRWQGRTVYIPNGVDMPQLQKPSMITAAYGLEGNDYILMVSRLVRHKGAHYLIEAFKQLDTNKKLVIVGDSAFTDNYVAELKQMAADDPRIIFTGYQSGQMLEELFSNAYMYVQPSESEGLSIAVLEAGSYGLPVLVSDIPANSEILQGHGYEFMSGSVTDLRDKLKAVLATPDQKLDATGKELKKYIAVTYNWDTITERTLALYQSDSTEMLHVYRDTAVVK